MRNDVLSRLDDHLITARQITPSTLVLLNEQESIVALPLANRRVILLWSPATPDRTLKQYIDNLVLGGYRGPHRVGTVGDACAMLRYYRREPGYLILKDAAIAYQGAGLSIGTLDGGPLPAPGAVL